MDWSSKIDVEITSIDLISLELLSVSYSESIFFLQILPGNAWATFNIECFDSGLKIFTRFLRFQEETMLKQNNLKI